MFTQWSKKTKTKKAVFAWIILFTLCYRCFIYIINALFLTLLLEFVFVESVFKSLMS